MFFLPTNPILNSKGLWNTQLIYFGQIENLKFSYITIKGGKKNQLIFGAINTQRYNLLFTSHYGGVPYNLNDTLSTLNQSQYGSYAFISTLEKYLNFRANKSFISFIRLCVSIRISSNLVSRCIGAPMYIPPLVARFTRWKAADNTCLTGQHVLHKQYSI